LPPVTTPRRKKATIDKAGLLNAHPLFRELGADVRAQLVTYAISRDFARGSVIFSKGDPGTCLFVVCDGVVQVTAPSTEGKNAVLNLIGAGEIFGEIALLDGQPRTADAIAFSDCNLMVIERRDFIPLLRSQPETAIRLIEILCSRLRRTTRQVEDLMFLDSTSRLAKAILQLSELPASEGGISASQLDLSRMVGLSREMINKQLGVWMREGWIRLARRRITVLRPDLLRDIAARETG
jgi:CRP-like cAMP-binding protein